MSSKKMQEMFEKFEDIPSALQDFYEKQEDGSGIFGGLDGETKRKIKEFRENNLAGKRKIEELEGALEELKDVDVTEYSKLRELKEKLEKNEEMKLIADGKLDEVFKRRTERMRDENAKALKAKDDALQKALGENVTLRNKVGRSEIRSGVELALTEAKIKVRDGAMDDVLSRAHGIFEVNSEGGIVPMEMGADGKRTTKYGPDSDPYNYENFVADLTKSGGHLIEGGGGGGAGGGGEGGDGVPTGANVVRKGDNKGFMNNLEDIASGKTRVVEG